MTTKQHKSVHKKKTLKQLYATHRGKVSDKWSSYLAEYERILMEYRDKPVRLLEIGVQNGGSLEIWSRYFSDARKIVGCDIDPTCAHLSYDDPRIAVVIGDANSDAAQEAIFGHAKTFDIIIDDGSHRSSDIVKSFARYFSHLAYGGIFIAEDLHCSYWRKFEGGLYDPFSAITFFKRLADVINHEHWGIEKAPTEILRGFFSKYGFYISDEALQAVHSVQFMNSVCAVRKEKPERNRLNVRVISGSVEMVVPGLLKLHSCACPMASLDQTDNEWTARSVPPDEELPLRINELAERDAQVTGLEARIGEINHLIAERDGHIAGLHQTITERDGRIASLQEGVTERDVQIAGLNEAVAERDGEIENLTQAVAEREAWAEALSAEIKDSREAVAERDGEIENLTQAVAERDGEIAGLDQELKEAQAVIAQITSGNSWRITRPLREIRRWVTNPSSQAKRYLPLSRQTRTAHRLFLAKHAPWVLRAANGLPPIAAPSLPVAAAQPVSESDTGLRLEYVEDIRERIDFSRAPVRVIAFYLPQFHPIPENNKWWGKGFTEWTNVTKAIPQYVGHYQPHLPGELGFYDLRLVDVQRQQIELARRYGIAGFCYHHYWFGGKQLLEQPFKQILANPDLDFPFCLCWANENWTRRWDGLEDDILIGQNHSPENDVAFIEDIADALRDPRYIRFNGRPVLLVYRAALLPDPQTTARRWRDYCVKAGIGDLYLVAAQSFGSKDPRPYGFDAAIEFPPHAAVSPCINDQMEIINSAYAGYIYDYNEMVRSYLNIPTPDYPLIKTVCPGWDNEARKPGRGHTFHGASPANYAVWLRQACEWTLKKRRNDPQHPPFVFVNAWNEWAEGAHLEPDRKFGYAYLHTTANIIRDLTPSDHQTLDIITAQQEKFERRNDTALVVHLYYEDLFDEIINYINSVPCSDKFITVRSSITPENCSKIVTTLPECHLAVFPNRGRDMQPFIQTLRHLIQLKYSLACKIHTKKSPQRSDGSTLRRNALKGLLGSKQIADTISSRFSQDAQLGLIVPKGSLLCLDNPDYNVLNRYWLDRLLVRLGRGDLVGNYNWNFAAGSMFWFRVAALAPIDKLFLSADDFEDELGQVDGTLAHTLERLMVLAVESQGLIVDETPRK